mgnify:FL=1
MNFKSIIEYIFPYLNGIRKLKDYLSFDLIFPKQWQFPTEFIERGQAVQNDKYQGEGIFLSFLCKHDDDVEGLIEVIQDLINFNLEREEKERLFKSKISELKKLFNSTSLDQLKSLEFNVYDETDHEEEHFYEGDDGQDGTLG